MRYVGELYTIAATNEVVYIGADLPDEYAHSEYTNILKGANAKAKANAVQGIPELIKISSGLKYFPNKKKKHNMVGIGMNQDSHYLYLVKMVRY